MKCWKCDRDLAGQKYMEHEKHPVCLRCYRKEYAKQCEYCMEYIIDQTFSKYEDKYWHKNCFKCTDCREPLSGKSFNMRGSRVYCGNCYDDKYSGSCYACKRGFRGDAKKFRYNDNLYHEECFTCVDCKKPMGEQSFYKKGDGHQCGTCHGDKPDDVCNKCDKKIASGAVVYKNASYHRECFVCTSCAKELSGQKFASHEGGYYCIDCYTRLFSKVCSGCNTPCTGLDGKYLTYKEKSWHTDCFNCNKCKKSLADEQFVPDGEGVLCTKCA